MRAFFAVWLLGAATALAQTPTQSQTFTESVLYGFPCSPTCQASFFPEGSLLQASDGNFYGTANGGPSGFGAVYKITSSGTLTPIYSFCSQGGARCTDGFGPTAGLIQGSDGNFYGTTSSGGDSNPNNCMNGPESGCGTVFKLTPSGTLTTLHSFCSPGGAVCADGFYPRGSLVQAGDGNFYGVTQAGGAAGVCNGIGCGTVFRISPSGEFSTIHVFCSQAMCTDGSTPISGLALGSDGNLYGTAYTGGATNSGSAFKLTLAGQLTVLHSFCSAQNCSDGFLPNSVIQGSDGNLYGTTDSGGAGPSTGTVFRITPSGTFTVLYNFCSTGNTNCPDGENPVGGLIEGSDGNFYGVTYYGGRGSLLGTAFRITPAGTLTTIYDFCSQGGTNCTDGAFPNGVIQASDGNLYGTTEGGGSAGITTCLTEDGLYNCGTVFKLTASPAEPFLSAGTAANGATYISGGLVPGSWAQVKGTDLSSITRIWQGSDFAGLGNGLPTNLSGVQVMVNGISAAVYYISPGQISFQVPSGISGNAGVQVINNGTASNTLMAATSTNSPGIFPVIENGVNYPAGVFLDGNYVGDPSLAGFRNAKPGDVIQLYCTGLVATPAGTLVAPQTLSGVTVTIGSTVIPADFAGLVAVGEFQVNFTIPQSLANQPAGNYPISVQVAGVSSPTTVNTNPPEQIVIPIQP